jgi:NADPH:quinone reductase-like Zn-dependent oxidoreductase
MKLRYKIAIACLSLVAAAAASGLAALRYEAPCTAAPPVPAGTSLMKAVVHRCYGSPDRIAIEDVPKPVPGDGEVLVKVRAVAVNPIEWHGLRGEPYVMRMVSGMARPNNVRMGVDFAGTVEAVGKDVTRFRVGDDVFGASGRSAAFAEYVRVVAENGVIASKPVNVSFEQAAAVPIAAFTALQALRDHGGLRPGQKVLINGAAGGVGTFAVQIAKALGAEVTGVCSTASGELVTRIGADHVIDYTREDFMQQDTRYDVIVDMVGGHSPAEYRRVLTPTGSLVVVSTVDKGRWLGPLTGMLGAIVYAPFMDQHVATFIAKPNLADLLFMADLMKTGKVVPAIDRRYAFDDVANALRYLEQGHAHGKVVVTLD